MGAECDVRLSVVVTLLVRPGSEAEFLDLLMPVLNAMRHEPSFINAALHRDPADPTRFMLYETCADRTDLVEVQMQRPYRSAYESRLPDLLREPRRAEMWQPLRGISHFSLRSAAEPALGPVPSPAEGAIDRTIRLEGSIPWSFPVNGEV